ncbi:MAG: hypothetical protein AAFO89_02940 [Planctomycetota bacterium]
MNTDDVRQKINAIAAEGENVTQRVREVSSLPPGRWATPARRASTG